MVSAEFASPSAPSQPTSRRRRYQSALLMSLAIASHFGGYELARASTLTVFSSRGSGFKGDAALPAAVGCVGPFSAALLWVRFGLSFLKRR